MRTRRRSKRGCRGSLVRRWTAWSLFQSLKCDAGKERRETGKFIGSEGVLKHLKDGPPRRRVGMVVEGAPARRT